MPLPNGSNNLICPIGPEYSQIGDTAFETLSTAPDSVVFPITKSIYEVWSSNVKTATVTFAQTGAVPNTPVSTTVSQWSIDESSNPIERNVGDHPFPTLFFSGVNLTSPTAYGSPNYSYLNNENPIDPILTEFGETAFPKVFIHRDAFYALIANSRVPFIGYYNLDENQFEANYEEDGTTTTATINNLVLFYP